MKQTERDKNFSFINELMAIRYQDVFNELIDKFADQFRNELIDLVSKELTNSLQNDRVQRNTTSKSKENHIFENFNYTLQNELVSLRKLSGKLKQFQLDLEKFMIKNPIQDNTDQILSFSKKHLSSNPLSEQERNMKNVIVEHNIKNLSVTKSNLKSINFRSFTTIPEQKTTQHIQDHKTNNRAPKNKRHKRS